MKTKFLFLSFIFFFARGCDVYSTSLWYFENPEYESNPLSSIIGLGWNGLIISNLVIVGIILFAHYYYTFKYSIQIPADEPQNMQEYISEKYYNQKDKFYQVYFRFPKNKRVLIGHNGYALIRAGIVGSFLAAIHNLCLFYQVSAYEAYSRIVGWPEYVVYGIIIFCMIYFLHKLWKKEYLVVSNHFKLVSQSPI